MERATIKKPKKRPKIMEKKMMRKIWDRLWFDSKDYSDPFSRVI